LSFEIKNIIAMREKIRLQAGGSCVGETDMNGENGRSGIPDAPIAHDQA
jgi:hypothetical protein